VTKLKHKIIENDDSRKSLENIMEGIADGVLVIDMDHTIIQANSSVAASLGLKKPEMIGRKCYKVMHRRQTPCEGPSIVCPLPHILGQEDNNIKLLHTHYDGNGNERHIEITASPVKNAKGRTIAMVETFRDIMEKYSDDELVKLVKRLNEAQTHLKHMAITDDLTGLRNRRYIIERLEEEFQRAKRSGDHLGLIMLDIDHFKQVNDVHGHLFGDVVLRVIASRIKLILRMHDIVGRVGGEEFLVICPESALADTVIVAERIRKIINDELIGDGIKELRVALSAGVTELHENDVSFEKLFSRADLALYKAKEEGRNRVVTL
jgi:diguanylate cyclase (GGDEF)-like protein/PAS domain S-box-containing protein